MMTLDGYIQKLKQLPPLMLKIVSSNTLTDAAIALDERHHLNGKQSRALSEIQVSLIGQEYAPMDVFNHVKNDLQLNEVGAKEVTIDFLGTLVLPVQWFVGNVEHIIQQLGGDPAPFVAAAKQNFPKHSVCQPSQSHLKGTRMRSRSRPT